MKPGDRVKAKAFGNKKIVRRVVQVFDTTVVICTESEWQAAAKEMRPADGVGFPVYDVIPLSA